MLKVSVIMPVYNGEKYIKYSIESILNQTFSDFELIIIDDGSVDDTEKIIKSYSDSRIKYFKKENSGITDSLNLALEKSQGEFIARMDADDISEPNRLERQLKFFEQNPEIVLCGSFAKIINENNEDFGEFNKIPLNWSDIKIECILHNPFIHSSVMFRRDLVNVVGGYNKKYWHTEDYELWTRIVNKYPCKNIPEFLLKYRISGNQITKKHNLKMRFMGLKVRVVNIPRFIFGSNL